MDTGVGIAPEDQATVFEEFRQVGTAAKKVEGTGLGLAIVYRILQAHQGRIRVEPGKDKGAEFIVEIPRTLRTRNVARKDSAETAEALRSVVKG